MRRAAGILGRRRCWSSLTKSEHMNKNWLQGATSVADQRRNVQTEKPQSTETETKQRTETAKTVSSWFMFPWERRQMDGEHVPLYTWEKIYWWIFVGGMAALLISWTQGSSNSKKDKKIDEELERKKQEMARAVLAGKSLTSADVDPFDGFTPRQIERYVQETTGASTDDPYEGMTPEEINEYVSKHGE